MTTTLTAVVTGAAGGLGRSISLRLASDGYNVVLSDLPSQQAQLQSIQGEIVAKGKQAHIVTGDVSKEEDVVSLVESAVAKFGSVDAVSYFVFLDCIFDNFFQVILNLSHILPLLT